MQIRLSAANTKKLKEVQRLSKGLCEEYCLSAAQQANLFLGPMMDQWLEQHTLKPLKPCNHRPR